MGILVSRFLTTIVAFVAIPIVVGKLGIAGYGTWESIIAVSLLCNIFQDTISGTLLWLISNAYGSQDTENIRKYVRMGVCISLTLFLVITPLAWFGRFFLIDLFKVPAQFVETAAWILPCVVGLMLLGSINEIMGALIGGFQRSGATTLTQAVAVTANNVSVIVCLLLGFGFWSLLVGFIVGFLFSAIGLYSVASRCCEHFSLLPLLPTKSVFIKILPYAGFMMLGAVSIALRDQTDKIVLSSVASPVWTGYYGIAVRLASLVTIICTFFYVPTIAASGALYSRGDLPGIHKLYNDVMTMMSFLVGLFVVLIGGMYDRLVMVWIGKPIPEVALILLFLLLGNAFAVILTGTGSSVCKGMGIVRIETIYILVAIILNLVLKFSLVPLMGAIGTVVSSGVSWSISSIIFVVLLHKQTGMPVSSTIKAIKTLGIVILCILVSRLITHIYPVEPDRLSVLISLMQLGLFLTTLFAGMMILFRVLPPNELRKITHLLRDKLTARFTKA